MKTNFVRQADEPEIIVATAPVQCADASLHMVVYCVITALAATMCVSAAASELVFYGGALRALPAAETTYSLALEYRRALAPNLSASLTWLNEGHLPGHHRDGQAAQLWWQTTLLGNRPVFALGLGPYLFFDTINASGKDGYANDHGWSLLASASATWYFNRRWFASLRVNRVQAGGSFNSNAVLAGLGYRFEPGSDYFSGNLLSIPAPGDARLGLDVMLGQGIVNNFESETALAKAVGLRVRVANHLAGSVTYLDEGDVKREKRTGVAAQIWLEDDDVSARLSVGAGVGPYFALDRKKNADGGRTAAVSGLISVTAAYVIAPGWVGRAVWNRVVTQDSSDSDIIVIALGYRF
jgi:hypothetical protein